MKYRYTRLLFYVMFLLVMIAGTGFVRAEASLRGLVTYQNTGDEVEAIQVTARGSSPVVVKGVSDGTGRFRLAFPNNDAGDTVRLNISTRIYELVNHPRDLLVVLPENPEDKQVHLVVCKRGERDRNAVEYYEISTRYLENAFAREKAELQGHIIFLQDSLTSSGGAVAGFKEQLEQSRQELEQLEFRYQAQLDNAWILANEFAQTDLAQSDSLYRAAFELFTKSDIEAARALLDGKSRQQKLADIYEKERQIASEKEKLEKMKAAVAKQEKRVAEEAKELEEVKKKEAASSLLGARMARLALDYRTAKKHLDEAMRLDSSHLEVLMAAGDYYSEMNQAGLALEYYQRGLKLSPNSFFKGAFEIKSGLEYFQLNQPEKAEHSFLSALFNFKRNMSGSDLYTSDVAQGHLALGVLYAQNKDDAGLAEGQFRKAIEIWKEISGNPAATYQLPIGQAYEQLAVFFDRKARFSEAEKAYREALFIKEQLAASDSLQYRSELISLYNNLGIFYKNRQEYDKAAQYLGRAIEIIAPLLEAAPEVYEPDWAKAKHNLGDTELARDQYKTAHEAYLESESIYRRLVGIQPDSYNPLLASTLNSMGNLYFETRYFQRAAKAYQEALNIYWPIVQHEPEQFYGEVAIVQYNVGRTALQLGDFESAVQALEGALERFESLAANNPEMYLPNLALIYKDLGPVYGGNGDTSQVEQAFQNGIKVLNKLVKLDSTIYTPHLAYAQTDLGFFYFIQQLPARALPFLMQSTATFRGLSARQPEVYEMELARALFIQGAALSIQGEQAQANERLLEAREIATRYPDEPFSQVINERFDEYYK